MNKNVISALLATSPYMVGGIMLWAGVAKLLDPVSLAETLNQISLLPSGLIPYLSLSLPILELILGLGLCLNIQRRGAWLGVAILMIFFTCYLIWSYALDGQRVCACLGSGFQTRIEVALVRNGLILALSSWAYCKLKDKAQ
jgi:uncharacterized membrane protein YphA (DoxX/SURF4 family)